MLYGLRRYARIFVFVISPLLALGVWKLVEIILHLIGS